MPHDGELAFNADANGRFVAHGYVISGDEQTGYQGRASLGLTGAEAAYGVREMLFATDLYDLLSQARAELIKRSMVGTAAEKTQADAERARGCDPGTTADARLAASAAGEFLAVLGDTAGEPEEP